MFVCGFLMISAVIITRMLVAMDTMRAIGTFVLRL